MDTRPIGPRPKPGRPGGPKPKPVNPKPKGPKLPGKPGKAKPGRTLIDYISNIEGKGKKKKNPNGKTAKAIGYAITGIQNRLKGGKKGPGKVGKLAR